MLPTYVIIGAPKAATTTLCTYFAHHPEMYMYPAKETCFFDRHFAKGIDWYEQLFRPPAGIRAIGEGTPNYAVGKPGVAKRIATHLPNARLIYIVRDPMKRIESHYIQQLDNGWKFESLAHALRTSRTLLPASLYWERISEFRSMYPDDQILVLFYEDFVRNPEVSLKRCYEFLGVSTDVSISVLQPKNTRAEKGTDRPLMRWLRRRKWYSMMNSMIPRGVVRFIKPLLRSRLHVAVNWDEETRLWVQGLLAVDSKQFLEFYGKPPDYW